MRHSEFRLFVSSTFRDLKPERDQLVKKVFPRLRAAARERGVEFTEIDLRWGITEHELHSGKLLRICLEEIEKCRPYFIGIMGSRYGFTPGAEAIAADPELFDSYSWLRDAVNSGNSITDIEFTHGAINVGASSGAVIYDQSTHERDPVDAERLRKLTERIHSAGITIRDFSSAEEFGEMVLADLLAVLDRDWRLEEKTSELSAIRSAHESFAFNRTRSYVADPEYFETFETFVSGDSSPLIVWGRSGLGKSSLMAHLLTSYEEKYPDAFVIEHYIGAGANESGATDIIRHVMLEIKSRYNLEDELPQEEYKLREDFPLWLAKLQDEKLVLGIDALNQLPGLDGELHWLPDFIPFSVRLVLSATPGAALDTLSKRNWDTLELTEISEAMRERIVRTYLERYGKNLPRMQLAEITQNSKTASPIFLRTLLEEIRMFGGHSNLGHEINRYLSSVDERELFQNVLIRMEADHGETTVRDVMTCIWASRFGLSEHELLGITNVRRLELSIFLIALEYHLMQRGGLYTFFHNYLREAVELRYLSDEASKREAHSRLGAYFSERTASLRRSNEEPYQWIEADSREQLLRMFADNKLFLFLAHAERHYELLGYWAKSNANDELPRVYAVMFDKAKAELSTEEQIKLFTILGGFLTAASQLDLAEQVLEDAVSLCTSFYGENHRETANTLRELATVYLHKSKLIEAIEAYTRAISVFENIQDLKEQSESRSNLAVVYYQLGKYKEAIENQRAALKMAEQVYGRIHPVVSEYLNNLASSLYKNDSVDEAEHLWNECIQIGIRTRGVSHPQTVRHQINLSNLLINIGKHQSAADLLRNALKIFNNLLGPKHPLIARTYIKNCEVLMYLGKYEDARNNCYKAIELDKLNLGENHLNVLWDFLRLARIEVEAGNLEEAQKYYSIYYSQLEDKLGNAHPEILKIRGRYLDVLKKLNRSEEI